MKKCLILLFMSVLPIMRTIKLCALMVSTILIAPLILSCSDENDDPVVEIDPDGPLPGTMYDLSPFAVTMKIVDENGVNVLNPEVAGNWMNQPFAMCYNDDVFPIDWDGYLNFHTYYKEAAQNNRSRFLPIEWIGLWCVKDYSWTGERWVYSPDEHVMQFGQFYPEGNLDLDLLLAVPDIAEAISIRVEHRGWWEKHDFYTANRIWLNGEELTGFPIEIVLPRRQD